MTQEEMLIIEARHAYASEKAQEVYKGIYEAAWVHWNELSLDERDIWLKGVRDKQKTNPLENEYIISG